MSNVIESFLANYSEATQSNALLLREVILQALPGITEQLDVPAKMIGYCYGQKYADLICMLIPSQKGLKLGFNRGTLLPDPNGLLQGSGKISRYVIIKTTDDIHATPLKDLLNAALQYYKAL